VSKVVLEKLFKAMNSIAELFEKKPRKKETKGGFEFNYTHAKFVWAILSFRSVLVVIQRMDNNTLEYFAGLIGFPLFFLVIAWILSLVVYKTKQHKEKAFDTHKKYCKIILGLVGILIILQGILGF